MKPGVSKLVMKETKNSTSLLLAPMEASYHVARIAGKKTARKH